jgi:FO synthase
MAEHSEQALRNAHEAGATVVEAAGIDDALAATAFAAGLSPVELAQADSAASAWVVQANIGMELLARGVESWRITITMGGQRAELLDALARTGAVFLRVEEDELQRGAELLSLPGIRARLSVAANSVPAAEQAVAAGARDLLMECPGDDWLGELRETLAPLSLIERVAFTPGLEIDDARVALDRPAFKTYLDTIDAHGAARPRTVWAPGRDMDTPVPARRLSAAWLDDAWVGADAADAPGQLTGDLAGILERSLDDQPPTRDEVERLFWARGAEVEAIARVADILRARRCGDVVTYVVNRNINYTNQCYFRCGFCGFSRGPKSLNLRGDPYILNVHEVVHRSVEAWERGATEVCLQGGIHPDFTGDFYVSVLEGIKERLPDMHVHGFTPLEVWQGAQTLGVSGRDFLKRLRDAGLGTLPGTAAEVLDDDVRIHLCPDKVRTAEWSDVMVTAHELGLRATTTLMFGHIDGPRSWANHLEVLRGIQRRTGGFTEFVPLPFVHMASPIYLQGKARPGPTWDEVVLIHAVGRIALDGLIGNIQASWVKLGLEGGSRLLQAGCNDLGGTLMDENISRASGASHGQLATPGELEAVIANAGRVAARRNTVYEILETV